jgi:hypothetical protein
MSIFSGIRGAGPRALIVLLSNTYFRESIHARLAAIAARAQVLYFTVFMIKYELSSNRGGAFILYLLRMAFCG